MKNKYFMAEEKGDTLDILIFGDITSWEWLESDVSSYTLAKLIQESGAKEITVHINSYGGEVAEGIAIYNSLKNHPAKVVTVCDGFACSAASVVFMAGEERRMNPVSLLMIHNAWTSASGNAAELRKAADDIEVVSRTAANAYLSCVNITEEELQAMLDSESWITPEEALEKGFATALFNEKGAAGQQYSAKETIIRQLAGGRGPSGAKDAGAAAGQPIPPDPPRDNFRKLFDTFNK